VAGHVGGLCLALRGRVDDRHVQKREELPRRLDDGVGEPLRAGFQPGDCDGVTAFAGLFELPFVLLALLAAGRHLVGFEVGHRAVEDEHRREVVFEELRESPDDPDEVRHLRPVGGRVDRLVGPLDGRRQVPVEPVVRVDGHDRPREVVEGHLLYDRQVPEVRVSHPSHLGGPPA